MSHPSPSTSYLSKEPLRSIGAQDLLRIDHSFSGFLRKEGKLEREIQFLSLFRWRQYFVVLSNGSVYIYNDEYSTNPKKCFSLSSFCRVERFEGGTNARNFCFKLVNKHRLFGCKDHNFACSSDYRRKEWMKHFVLEMLKANDIDISNVDLNEYDDIEHAIDGDGRFGSLSLRCWTNGGKRNVNSGDEAAAIPRLYATLSSENKPSFMGKFNLKNQWDSLKSSRVENGIKEKQCKNEKPKLKPKPLFTQSCQSPVGNSPSETEEEYITMEFPNNPSTRSHTAEEPSFGNCQNSNLGVLKNTFEDCRRLSLQVTLPSIHTVTVETISVPGATDYITDLPRIQSTGRRPINQTFTQNFGGFTLFKDGTAIAERLVERKPEGSYLVVETKTGSEYVILVSTKSGVKKCPIYYELRQWYIKKPAIFDSLQNLIEFYRRNKVPNVMTALRDKAET